MLREKAVIKFRFAKTEFSQRKRRRTVCGVRVFEKGKPPWVNNLRGSQCEYVFV
jgi:hypothetical protein